jgi:hypothetical protein
MPFPAFFFLAAALAGKDARDNRRDKKTALDLESERLDTINNLQIGLDSAGISNQFDAEQMEAMREQFVGFKAMAASKDPRTQAAGWAGIQSLSTSVRGNIQQNEG